MTTKIVKCKIVEKSDGKFTVNQESNGYWWYHDTEYSSFGQAEAAIVSRSNELYAYVIDQNYVPVRMRMM